MDAATLEETNRIRVSLGMKPLPVPGGAPPPQLAEPDDGELPSTLESRQAQAYDNYNRAKEAEAAKLRREEKAKAVRKAREQAQKNMILEGKGLGEEDGVDVSAKDWLVGQKKRQKKISKARKLEEELAAAEAAAAAAVQYTSKDLAGIKVAHDTADFLDGDDQILTLKDTTIDQNEEEGDELENLNMREATELSERLDLKKRTHQYNPHDDEECENGILSQYDEEINGKKRKKFTLDAGGIIAGLSDILDQPVDKTASAQNISLDDIVGDGPVSSDYLDPSKIKVKKPKKSKKKSTRQKPVDEDDIFPTEPPLVDSNAMDIDTKESTKKKRKLGDDAFVDDEDLQASLAIQRKNALKKRKKSRPEDIAKQLKEQAEDEEPAETQDGGLVLGEVSEFVAGLSKPEESEVRRPKKASSAPKSPRPDEDHPMKDDDQVEDEPEKPRTSAVDELDETGVEAEKTVGQGMASALALLRERGLIEAAHGESDYESFRDREDFLARKRRLEQELDEQARQQRERDRMSGKLDRMSVREREDWARQQNTWRDQQQSRRMAELFSAGYKPKVQLKYTDDHGRALDQKEAFKHLSHQFHGKGSGKGKTEKLLKKIEEEKRREAQSLFDANQSAGMNMAAQQQLKKRREAGVRLA
ncbi:SART-1 protein [Thelonectria olida]|uniref:SART-1 protein n=1 Tax=Thelonectria olida TaxID=1576542 RepID=A0A9P9ATH3_9HYPO|nr:SART-1 protein [Thelonectria olida]